MEPQEPRERRTIPDPGFAGDTGLAAPEVTAALAAHAAGTLGRPELLLRLQDSRVLVPVVAVLGEVEVDAAGLAHDKTSDMATVLLTGRDGRQALLGFTGSEQMARWDPAARPVPVPLGTAAASAVQEGAAALLLDVAGPVALPVEGRDLHALAAGWRLVRDGDGYAWIGTEPV